MRAECVEAITRAVGRALNQGELKDIEDRLARNMRQQARRNPPEWRSMSMPDRLNAAAKSSAAELVAEAAKKAERVQLQVEATSRNMAHFNSLREPGKNAANALGHQLEQLDTYTKGVQRSAFADLLDTLHAASPKFLGLIENAHAVRDFVREVFGERTGNESAAKGAKAWLSVVDELRQRFNRAGGDVRKLSYGYLPQPHDAGRILKAPADRWALEVLPFLDRTRYIHEDGTRYTNAQMLDELLAVHETLTTGGLKDLDPGKYPAASMRAKRHGQARELHFKDPQSYLDYMGKYGRGSVYDALSAHVTGLARDIGLVESMGPNPDHMFRYLDDMAKQIDGGEKMVGPLLVRNKDLWSALSGVTSQTVNQRLGVIAQGVRNWTVAAKLQNTLLSSMTDVPTMIVTAYYNRLPVFATLANVFKTMGRDQHEQANRMGLVADSVISDMNRWSEDHVGQNFAGRLANSTMKISLLNAWTDALRRGFSVSLMGSIGKLVRTDWAGLDEFDRMRMSDRGVTEGDWKVWQAAKPEAWGKSAMVTPNAIKAIESGSIDQRSRDQAISRLLGFIAEESETAVVSQDLMARAAVTRSTQKGTIEGEFLRSLMLFKSFPMAMISRHLSRIAKMSSVEGGPSGTAYAVSLGLGLGLFGALSIQLKALATGQDPHDMSRPAFWGAAMAQGGGLGIYGDILYTSMGGQARGGQANWTSLGGPVFGSAFDLADLTLGNVGQAARGQNTHAGAELLRFGRSNLPLVNLWYARAAIDHLFFHELQESASPGYLASMRSNAQRNYGSGYWWEPGQGVPDRAPDLATAIGN